MHVHAGGEGLLEGDIVEAQVKPSKAISANHGR